MGGCRAEAYPGRRAFRRVLRDLARPRPGKALEPPRRAAGRLGGSLRGAETPTSLKVSLPAFSSTVTNRVFGVAAFWHSAETARRIVFPAIPNIYIAHERFRSWVICAFPGLSCGKVAPDKPGHRERKAKRVFGPLPCPLRGQVAMPPPAQPKSPDVSRLSRRSGGESPPGRSRHGHRAPESAPCAAPSLPAGQIRPSRHRQRHRGGIPPRAEIDTK